SKNYVPGDDERHKVGWRPSYREYKTSTEHCGRVSLSPEAAGVLGACVASALPQNPYAYRESQQAYREPPQTYREPVPVYQDESRYPAPKPEQYIAEPPKYQKKYQQEEDQDYDEATNAIPGEPGKDYPIHSFIPSTSFSCSDKLPGFYADEGSSCQVWHYCKTDGLKESFLCPNGTIYNQANRVCEWWFNVSCDSDTIAQQYKVNEDLYIIPSPKPDAEYAPAPPKYSSSSRSQYVPEPQYQGYQDQPTF
ncbi:U-scoloptoxin(01)-Er1a-like 9, partial [Homarus americanus]